MNVFVTGSTGFIGTAVVRDLLANGHRVLGLSRSEEGVEALLNAGAQALKGDLEDLDSLREGASKADGVIHLAFVHDFTRFQEVCAIDVKAIGAMVGVLKGTDKHLIITSGTAIAMPKPGKPVNEDDSIVSSADFPRAASEEAAQAAAKEGVSISIMRLPQVHGRERQGLITLEIATAKEKGYFAYLGDGQYGYPSAHRIDVARLYRLALEKGEKGAVYNAVAEESISHKAIAETLGKRFGLPAKSITKEEAPEYFGWLAHFMDRDLSASSEKTKKALGWKPNQIGLLEDLAQAI